MMGGEMKDNIEDIERIYFLLQKFIHGADRSLRFAGEIEASIDEIFPDDDYFQDIVEALSSYRPGGGEFLYDEEEIARMLKRALDKLKDHYRVKI
jgi:hypothetical protein